jgi:hypothetical protein
MNVLMAGLAARLEGVGADVIREAVIGFKGVEHRLEFVCEVDGVKWINDSKATNVDSVVIALQSYRQPVVLIAGGRDKGASFEPLYDLIKERVRAMVLIGEAGEKMAHAFAPCTKVSQAGDMMEAVNIARMAAQPGDIAMLSPACASFRHVRKLRRARQNFQGMCAYILQGTDGGMKQRTGHIDLYIFLSVLAIMLFSVGVVYSASVSISGIRHDGDYNYLFRNHSVRVIMGVAALFVGMFVNYHLYGHISKIVLVVALALLAYTLVGGTVVKGAQRWVSFGPLSFQPSEFAKFALVMHLAVLLAAKQKYITHFRDGFLPLMIWIGIVVGLIFLQPNFSTGSIILGHQLHAAFRRSVSVYSI